MTALSRKLVRRGLVAAAGLVVVGSVTAFAAGRDGRPGCDHHRGPMTATEAAQREAAMVERVGQQLDLTAAQKLRLKTLAEVLRAQRQVLMGAAPPHEQWRPLIAGDHFDRAAAQALADARAQRVRDATPVVIAAAADFFDTLEPAQQAKVRNLLEKGPHRRGFGGPPEHDGPGG